MTRAAIDVLAILGIVGQAAGALLLLAGLLRLAGVRAPLNRLRRAVWGYELDAVIVGIGVNLVNEVPPYAVSLAEASGHSVDRAAFVASLLSSVERWVDRYIASGLEAIIPAWQDRMAIGLSARATVDGAPLVGAVAGLDQDGALLLRDDLGNLHRVRSGDVEVLRPAC